MIRVGCVGWEGGGEGEEMRRKGSGRGQFATTFAHLDATTVLSRGLASKGLPTNHSTHQPNQPKPTQPTKTLQKAAVIGDTVGDPLKDTSGPSLNILIKLMAVESLVFAPFFFACAKGEGLIFQFFA